MWQHIVVENERHSEGCMIAGREERNKGGMGVRTIFMAQNNDKKCNIVLEHAEMWEI